MNAYLLVGLGGALGAMARFGVGRLVQGSAAGTAAFPAATFAVNVTGGLLIGLLAGWIAQRGGAGEAARLFLGIGLLGGFTTFSAFSLEMMGLIQRGATGVALLYAFASVALALAALAAGLALARALFA